MLYCVHCAIHVALIAFKNKLLRALPVFSCLGGWSKALILAFLLFIKRNAKTFCSDYGTWVKNSRSGKGKCRIGSSAKGEKRRVISVPIVSKSSHRFSFSHFGMRSFWKSPHSYVCKPPKIMSCMRFFHPHSVFCASSWKLDHDTMTRCLTRVCRLWT